MCAETPQAIHDQDGRWHHYAMYDDADNTCRDDVRDWRELEFRDRDATRGCSTRGYLKVAGNPRSFIHPLLCSTWRGWWRRGPSF
jgi:hypothetical protein